MKYNEMTEDELIKIPQEHRLLVIIAPSISAHAQQVSQASWRSVEGMAWSEHGVSVALGYLGDAKPLSAVVTWDSNAQISSFEIRWLITKKISSIKSLLSYKAIDICVLDAKPQLAQVVAEDIWAQHQKVWQTESSEQSTDRLFMIKSQHEASEAQSMRSHRLQGWQGCRNWVNENPDHLTSIAMAERLADFAKAHDCSVEILTEVELLKEGMNLLLAVGQSSKLSPPRLIVLRNKHAQSEHVKPHVLVGKGITFDTGGINVKPYEAFVHCMKNDMGGAALMSHLFMTAVKCQYQGPLALVVPSCENLVDGLSMKPGTVIKSRSGKHVMIEHTDAEGRLILADALSYANDHMRPSSTWVAATLTTAALRQFSNYYTAVHFADESQEQAFRSAGNRWGELYTFWQHLLPFVDSNFTAAADLTNLGKLPSHSSSACGSNVAAHFLKEFIDGPLLHFDIFASAWNWSGDYPGANYGATGAPFHSMLEVLMRQGGRNCDPASSR